MWAATWGRVLPTVEPMLQKAVVASGGFVVRVPSMPGMPSLRQLPDYIKYARETSGSAFSAHRWQRATGSGAGGGRAVAWQTAASFSTYVEGRGKLSATHQGAPTLCAGTRRGAAALLTSRRQQLRRPRSRMAAATRPRGVAVSQVRLHVRPPVVAGVAPLFRSLTRFR